MDIKLLAGIIIGVVVLSLGIGFLVGDKDESVNIETTTPPQQPVEEIAAPEEPEQDFEPIANPTPETTTHTVAMRDFAFEPKDITVRPGDTVTWVNEGKGKHYVLTTRGKRILDSGYINPGDSWSYTFTADDVGGHVYFSPIYEVMKGSVLVTSN